MFRVSLKNKLVIMFLLLTSFVSFSLIYSSFYYSKAIAIKSIERLFTQKSEYINSYITNKSHIIRRVLMVKSQDDKILEPITFDTTNPLIKEFIEILKLETSIHAIYFSQKDGDIFSVTNLHGHLISIGSSESYQHVAWRLDVSVNKIHQIVFFDKKLNVIEKTNFNPKLNSHISPWYKKALATSKIIRTKPYAFAFDNELGITLAKAHKSKNAVIGIDMAMTDIEHMLQVQKIDNDLEVFLVDPDNNGQMLASSDSLEINKAKIENNKPVAFTEVEKDYIATHRKLFVSNDSGFAPFDFQLSGIPVGYSIDLLKLISIKSGLQFSFKAGDKFSDIKPMFKKKQLDILNSVYKDHEMNAFGRLSHPIYQLKHQFVVKNHQDKIKNTEDLKNKTLAVVNGRLTTRYMKENFPKIKLLMVNNMMEAINAVSIGQADAAISTAESFKYLSEQLFIDNLKINGWFKQFDNEKHRGIYLLLQIDQPVLLSIINKTLESITKPELSQLHLKWFENLEAKVKSKGATIDAGLIPYVFDKKLNTLISYQNNGDNYLAILSGDNDFLLGFKINELVLLQPYYDNINKSFFVAVIFFFLSLPLIFLGAKYLANPIKALISENNKIKSRKFHLVKSVKTHIFEYNELSNSLVSMSKSMEQHDKEQIKLFDAIVGLISEAIDNKSPYTGSHCKRVPEIARSLIFEANKVKTGSLKDFSMTSKDALREFEIGAMLHDCGKVSSPINVVDKATKLESIYNRIHEIRMRFEVLWRDAYIDYLKGDLNKESLQIQQQQLQDDFEFIANVNLSGEYMREEDHKRVQVIAKITWQRNFDNRLGLSDFEKQRYKEQPQEKLPAIELLLSDQQHHLIERDEFNFEEYAQSGFKEKVPQFLYNYGEVYNLSISKGTLTEEERYIVKEHVITSIKMLEKIPFPAHLAKIPQYAGTHHETLNGSGYPRKLDGSQLSIPDRIMAIADIFEALTSSDRPYKKAKKLSESIKIMSFMVKDQLIDKDLFELFLTSGAYLDYANKHLTKEQLDVVDIDIDIDIDMFMSK